jgi:HAE1 family hydrophobic/amphiphilic exporter-1
LPDDAKTPTVRTSNSDDSPIARLALIAREGVKIDLEALGRFVETDIVEPLGRTKGVSEVTFNGGGRQQMRVVIDPEKMIRYQISLAEVIDAIKSSSTLQSVGSVTEGKRSYPVRTELIAYTREKAGEIVIRTDISSEGSNVPLLLSDVADIELKVQKRSSYRRLNGEEAVTFSVLREQGTNVVSTMSRLRVEIEKLNQNILRDRGLDLKLIFEETTYISSAINLVQQNIWIGGCLAIGILMLFLRSLIPTSIIFIAIPVSVIGTFVAIAGLGLSINVISLAGLAFTIEASTTIPIAKASPAKEITLIERPSPAIATKVPITETGIAIKIIEVGIKDLKNSIKIPIAKQPPIQIFC